MLRPTELKRWSERELDAVSRRPHRLMRGSTEGQRLRRPGQPGQGIAQARDLYRSWSIVKVAKSPRVDGGIVGGAAYTRRAPPGRTVVRCRIDGQEHGAQAAKVFQRRQPAALGALARSRRQVGVPLDVAARPSRPRQLY